MKTGETRNDNNVGTFLLIVLCFLCIAAFSDTQEYHSLDSHHNEFTSSYRVNSSNAVIWHDDLLTSVQKSWFSVDYNTGNDLVKASSKIANENRQITQTILRLQKDYRSIKPGIRKMNDHHPVRYDTGEPPLVS